MDKEREELLVMLDAFAEHSGNAIFAQTAAAIRQQEKKRKADVRQCWVLASDHPPVAQAIFDAFPDCFEEKEHD